MLMLAIGTALTTSAAYAAEGTTATEDSADGYVFDASLFRGGNLSAATMKRFNRADAISPATYMVDVYINRRFLDRADVPFRMQRDGSVKPCLPRALLDHASILATAIRTGASPAEDDDCLILDRAVEGSSTSFDLPRLRLDLSVPQSLMKQVPRGYVAPSELDHGDAIAFLNYIGNAYHVSYGGSDAGSQNSAYLSINGGLNLGRWRLRQQSNVSDQQGMGIQWTNTRSYASRGLPSIGSALTVGQNFTTGRIFSGLSYTGVTLATDDRMLPDSMRGYAPVVRGVARTNARVSIRQNGNEIYQTTVVPGPFEIGDLYPTSYNGDLDVVVTEADGSINQFTVPFAAVPESLRPGISRYEVTMGRTRQAGDHADFGDLTYQRGLSNAVTANGGLRIAGGYQAVVLGGAYSSPLGAFGLDATYSRADMPTIGYTDGWMAHLSYSRTYQPTNTTLSIAGYRYSTAGYRDLGDVLGVRLAVAHGGDWQSSTYMQRARFEVSINQRLGSWGNVYLSGSTQDYRDGRSRDTQVQLGYATMFRHSISMNLSVARMRMSGYTSASGSYDDPYGNDVANRTALNGSWSGSIETVTMLSFSIPLGSNRNIAPSSLNTSYSHSDTGGTVYQATMSGTTGADRSVSYGLGATRDVDRQQTVLNGNLQKRLPDATIGVTASRGDNYWQASVNAQGALAIHGGGITFGPYLGDTFALIEAKGAEGARVLNGMGAAIDGRGYALVPSMTPYRYNTVALNPEGMKGKTELEDGEQRVAPDAGAAVKVVFRTRSGNALLIRTRLSDGRALPMGTEVYDESGKIIGMVGQGGQVYVRSDQARGMLDLRWGEGVSDRCTLPYDLAGQDLSRPIIRLQHVCTVHQPLPTTR
ncbi:fimbria/pilus outer membrane usher protein [Dyella sp. C9]|uniref:fimbria/pilus outer membrane usher protein n=1 Tax=Dyella sp. C9 TaxID=2202154 RepID=UPI000DEFDAEA|nr:fimbria/pilus outer membrane usher protein [Dyella sp. C9]